MTIMWVKKPLPNSITNPSDLFKLISFFFFNLTFVIFDSIAVLDASIDLTRFECLNILHQSCLNLYYQNL